MPDSLLASRGRRPAAPPAAITAAAQLADISTMAGATTYMTTAAAEDELWSFYDSLGEFASFVDWMSRAMSRVRLGAAEQMPGGDEPAFLTDGPAADLMDQFYGGTAGHAAFMEAMTTQLLVPGQGWLVPERFDTSTPLVLADWSVQSSQTFRARRFAPAEIQVAPGQWRTLLPDSLPTRIWMPNRQFPYLAKSPSLAALPIMRRIDLIDKRIVAELLSRLVMNGIMWIPMEGQLPSSPKYAHAADPFFAELIDIAGKNIATPGSALAAVPMPVKYPGDLIEKIKLMRFAEPFDEQLLVERDREIARLAQTLPLSRERQEGFKDANHWNGFIVDADDIKISIAPLAEVEAHGVTVGWLQPMLAIAGESLVGPNGGRILAWPDYSELVSKPDNREAVREAYDRGEVSGEALRRESGLSESDRPDDVEQAHMIWLKAARDGSNPANPTAIQKLTGEALPAPSPGVGAAAGPEGATPDVVGSPTAESSPTPGSSAPLAGQQIDADVASAFVSIGHRVNGHTANGRR